MRTTIQVTTGSLEAAERRTLESEVLRAFARYTREVEQATVYISAEEPGEPRCRLSVMALGGARHSAEGSGPTYQQAVQYAANQIAAALQRDVLRRTDPRMNRPGRGSPGFPHP